MWGCSIYHESSFLFTSFCPWGFLLEKGEHTRGFLTTNENLASHGNVGRMCIITYYLSLRMQNTFCVILPCIAQIVMCYRFVEDAESIFCLVPRFSFYRQWSICPPFLHPSYSPSSWSSSPEHGSGQIPTVIRAVSEKATQITWWEFSSIASNLHVLAWLHFPLRSGTIAHAEEAYQVYFIFSWNIAHIGPHGHFFFFVFVNNYHTVLYWSSVSIVHRRYRCESGIML